MIQTSSTTPASLTLEEIEGRLPLVRRIASDLVQTWRHVLQTRLELEAMQRDAADQDADAIHDLAAELDRSVRRVQGYLAEVEQLGGCFQEYRRGVVTFPMQFDGRTVLACWMSGEDRVLGWHEKNETINQRRAF
ncbi:MAG: DUF2203 family protein [Planctomycetota bacterium]